MKKTAIHRILSLFTTVFTTSILLMTACKEDTKLVPYCGSATYEVTYSKDIGENNTIGPALPRTLTCVFDPANTKTKASAPFGLAKCAVVLTKKDSYITIDFDRAKLLLSLDEFTGNIGAYADSLHKVEIIESNELVNISDFMSQHVTVRLKNSDSNVSVDFFFIPFGSEKDKGQTEKLHLFDNPQSARLPGLMTAMNVKYDECNIMLVIKDLKPKESVDKNEFERPRGYIEASRHDLLAMRDLMLN